MPFEPSDNIVFDERTWKRRALLSALGTLGGTAVMWPLVRQDLNAAQIATAVAEPVPLSLVEAVQRGAVDFDDIPMVPPWGGTTWTR